MMSSYQDRKPTVEMILCDLHNGIFYIGWTSFYWIRGLYYINASQSVKGCIFLGVLMFYTAYYVAPTFWKSEMEISNTGYNFNKNNVLAQWQNRPGYNLGAPWLIIRRLEIDLQRQLFWNTKSLLRSIPKIPYILMGYTAQSIAFYEAFIALWHAIWKRGKRRGCVVITECRLHYWYLFCMIV